MAIKRKLLSELSAVRDRLKISGQHETGRMPSICTDAALEEMARILPQRLEDFACVTGIGKTFIEKYGAQFLPVLQQYAPKARVKSHAMTDHMVATLKELNKRLVNISRRNRLLYFSKIQPRSGLDLFDPSGAYDPLDVVMRNRTIQICDLSRLPATGIVDDEPGADGDGATPMRSKADIEQRRYKLAVSLGREINKNLNEIGRNDLYVGYPFVRGCLSGNEDFNVRAPLVLFPVTMNREGGRISLGPDASRDIIYNSVLVLAHFKFNEINKPLPECEIDECKAETFLDNMKAYYHAVGIDLTDAPDDAGALGAFRNYLASEFPKFRRGQLEIEHSAVLGKFSICDNAIQKDFNTLLNAQALPDILSNMLTSIGDLSDANTPTKSSTADPTENLPITISEHDLTYIGDLNSSQENVIAAVAARDAIVVQGPPGTGKSQTIASLIADSVHDGFKVLMVSEKKSALDVVYSRLGELNKYALMLDDANDKLQFYGQMSKIFSLKPVVDKPFAALDSADSTIDQYVMRFEQIADKLYAMNEFGIEVYKLYHMDCHFDLSKSDDADRFRMLKMLVTPSVVEMHYPELEKSYQLFRNQNLTASILFYLNTRNRNPWIEALRENLSDFDLIDFPQQVAAAQQDVDAWKKQFVLLRFFTKGKLLRSLHERVGKYFDEAPRVVGDLFLKSGIADPSGIKDYAHFSAAKASFGGLSAEERNYFASIAKVATELKQSLSDANENVFNFALSAFLLKFEGDNRSVFGDIQGFRTILSELDATIGRKKKISRKVIEQILNEKLSANMIQTKRQGEMARIIDSTRKWSVKKFVNTFRLELMNGIQVWLMTPEVVSELLPLEVGLFDLIVFDEASQMYVEKGLPSIFRGRKVVIAGDNQQLQPSSLGAGRIEFDAGEDEDSADANAALEEDSLLEVAWCKYRPPVRLNFHYRSKYEELIAFSNYAFYQGGLYVSPNVESPEHPPIEVIKVDNGQWIKRVNRAEAERVVALLKEVFATRKNNETVGVITFNITQRDMIEDLLDEACSTDAEFATTVKSEIARVENGENIGLFVKNIENVQGDERDIIIFSFGYAPGEKGVVENKFGWLNAHGGENRLNVAISRSKRKIYIVTSIEPSQLNVNDTKNRGPKYLKKYLEYCYAVSGGNKELAQEILKSLSNEVGTVAEDETENDFENQIFTALKAAGFEVEQNIGIGGYSIDLAIKQGARYVLGIECDGRLYHASHSARERDYHRQKYLEARGWKLYRVWSYAWWHNPQVVIEKIRAEIAKSSTLS